MTQDDLLPTDFALGLANAVILASDAPSLLLGADLTIIMASGSFCRSFGINPARVLLAPLTSLGKGEWDVPQLTGLLLATASGRAAVEGYEMDMRRNGEEVRNLLLSAHKLALSDDAPPMVLLSVVDVTETRRRERQTAALVQEKALLLSELNHRVANSLQIIASLLLQSARTVQSEEARTHIHAAHHRLMSVAGLQKQLAISDRDEVVVAEYLSSLCRSIGASMIRDRSLLTLAVEADDSTVPPNVALSLGLIVTELVINAIKHAFPGEKAGQIVVTYASTGAAWSLSVGDDGVGMPKEPHEPKSGLGTNIVRALVMQLDAEIAATSANPGTLVVIRHDKTDTTVAGIEIAAV